MQNLGPKALPARATDAFLGEAVDVAETEDSRQGKIQTRLPLKPRD